MTTTRLIKYGLSSNCNPLIYRLYLIKDIAEEIHRYTNTPLLNDLINEVEDLVTDYAREQDYSGIEEDGEDELAFQLSLEKLLEYLNEEE